LPHALGLGQLPPTEATGIKLAKMRHAGMFRRGQHSC
jgi:hypothetical protein